MSPATVCWLPYWRRFWWRQWLGRRFLDVIECGARQEIKEEEDKTQHGDYLPESNGSLGLQSRNHMKPESPSQSRVDSEPSFRPIVPR